MTGGSFAWPPLGDDQRELLALVRTLATERIAPRAAEIDETHEFPWDIVELYREQGLFGLFFEERHGGTGTGPLLALAAIEEVSKVCATSGVILAVQELGSLALKLAGSEEQKVALPSAARLGRMARRLRADGVGVGVGLGRDAHDGAARRRRLRAERRQAVHHERRRRESLHRLRPHRSDLEAPRHQRLRRRVRLTGLRGRAPRAEARDRRVDDRRARLQRLPRACGEPDRDGGRRLRARDARARPLPRRHRRPGGRDRRGSD